METNKQKTPAFGVLLSNPNGETTRKTYLSYFSAPLPAAPWLLAGLEIAHRGYRISLNLLTFPSSPPPHPFSAHAGLLPPRSAGFRPTLGPLHLPLALPMMLFSYVFHDCFLLIKFQCQCCHLQRDIPNSPV